MTYHLPKPDDFAAPGIAINCDGASFAELLDDLTIEAVHALDDLDRLPAAERALAERLADAADPDSQILDAVTPLIAKRRPRAELLAAGYRVALSFRSRCDCEIATPDHVDELVAAAVAKAVRDE